MQLDDGLDKVLSPYPAAGRRARMHDKFFFLSDVGNAVLRDSAPDSFIPRTLGGRPLAQQKSPLPALLPSAPCAPFGKALKRTATSARFPASLHPADGRSGHIHANERRTPPMDFEIHGTPSPIHGMFPRKRGAFPTENARYFCHIVAKNAIPGFPNL